MELPWNIRLISYDISNLCIMLYTYTTVALKAFRSSKDDANSVAIRDYMSPYLHHRTPMLSTRPEPVLFACIFASFQNSDTKLVATNSFNTLIKKMRCNQVNQQYH